MSKQKSIILILSIMGLIASFFPLGVIKEYENVLSVSFYTKEYGPGNIRYIFIIAYLIPIVICIINKNAILIQGSLILAVVPPLIISILLFVDIINANKYAESHREITGEFIQFELGPGYWVLLFVGLLIPFITYLLNKAEKNSKKL